MPNPTENDSRTDDKPTTFDLPGPGDRVRDRDNDDSGALIVVETFPQTAAADYEIDALGETVADRNPDHPDAAPAAKAVYLESADRRGVESTHPRALRADVGAGRVRAYTFPVTRLAVIDSDHPLAEVWGVGDGPDAADDDAAGSGGGRGV
jgi:hypothetical protein